MRIVSVFNGIDVRDLAPGVAAPTLILHRRGDAQAPFDEGRLLATLIPGAQFVPLEGDSHILFTAELAAVRAATERFRDVDVALAEGYIRDPGNMCFIAPMEGYPRQLGGMGIHFVRPDLLGTTGAEPRVSGTGTHADFRSPGVLVYEPQPDGSLALVAVEAHGFEPHYELHVWLYRQNPIGVFSQFNPSVTCEYHRGHTVGH